MDLSNENVVHIHKEGIEYLQFRRLLTYQDELSHAYSLGIDKNYRTINVSQEQIPEEQYHTSYQILSKAIGSNYQHLVKPNQAHTQEVKIVTHKINGQGPDINLKQYNQTDGLITNQKQILLGTTNADCILLLFYDPIQKVIANVHSGWRGTWQRIASKTVDKMVNQMGCQPQDMICCICPSIRKCHFEVEEEVKDMFEKEFQELKPKKHWIEETIPHKKWNIDTVYLNQQMLKNKGLRLENIIDSGICSVCHSDKIHSYRVEKKAYGLNTAVMELK